MTMRALALLLLPGLLFASPSNYTGRPLTDVLRELQENGLRIVYSSDLVTTELRVKAEPTSSRPRKILDEVLAPHGLEARKGPAGSLLVVRSRRKETPREAKKAEGSIVICLSSGETPLADLSVRVVGREETVRTEANGTVRIPGLSPGVFALEAELPRFRGPGLQWVTVERGESARVNLQFSPTDAGGPPEEGLTLFLTQTGHVVENVDVAGRVTRDTAGAPVILEPASVAAIAGGGENVFRSLQALPGVAAPDDFDSRLAVRGGGPDQNLTVMDGVEIHDPYRLFSFASAFNPSIVDHFEFYPGGFDVRYGDRLSSLLLIENRAGSRDKALQGEASVSLTDASAVVEGRLPGRGEGSWLFAGRRTYYDLIAESFVDSGNLPSFSDLQAKFSWVPRANQRLTIFGLGGRESTAFHTVDEDEDFEILTEADNGVFAAVYDAVVGETLALKSVVSYSRFLDSVDFHGRIDSDARRTADLCRNCGAADVVFVRELELRDLALRQEATLFASERHTLEAGFEAHRLDTGWSWNVAGAYSEGTRSRSALPFGSSGLPGANLPRNLDSSVSSWRVGAWAQDRIPIGSRVTLQPGLRVDRSTLNEDLTFSPRLGASWNPTPSTRVHGAVGLHHQSPGYEKLFQADYFVDLGSAAGLESARALHVLLGFEKDLVLGLTARVDAYRKTYRGLVSGRLETDEERRERLLRYDYPPSLASELPLERQITSIPDTSAEGSVSGFELTLRRPALSPTTAISGWVSYTYGVADREAYGRTYPFDYDRRHALSLVAEWRLSRRWSFGFTGRVASGFPRTPAVGVRVAADEDVLDIDGDGDRAEYVPARDNRGALVYTPFYGDVSNLNAVRLPTFARLDARVTFHPGSAARWLLYVDLINVLGRENAGQIETTLRRGIDSDLPLLYEEPILGLPFLPSFGVRFRF
jgi:hypothetical protein